MKKTILTLLIGMVIVLIISGCEKKESKTDNIFNKKFGSYTLQPY